MPVLSPISRVGTALWNYLGLGKSSGQAFTGVSGDITPTINVAPFVSPEIFSMVFAGGAAWASGYNSFGMVNDSGRTRMIVGCAIDTSVVNPAGATIEVRPMLVSDNVAGQVRFPLGVADFAGVGETIVCGGQFFNDPIPWPPGWTIQAFVSTITGVPSVGRLNVLYVQV